MNGTEQHSDIALNVQVYYKSVSVINGEVSSSTIVESSSLP
jgi:hypothetical protein